MLKKTTCCEQFLEIDTRRCVFEYLTQLIDISKSLMRLILSFYKTMEMMTMSEIFYLETQQ